MPMYPLSGEFMELVPFMLSVPVMGSPPIDPLLFLAPALLTAVQDNQEVSPALANQCLPLTCCLLALPSQTLPPASLVGYCSRICWCSVFLGATMRMSASEACSSSCHSEKVPLTLSLYSLPTSHILSFLLSHNILIV
jgi:hypothetical protein